MERVTTLRELFVDPLQVIGLYFTVRFVLFY